ncbi:MAG: replication-associated recombination protein A [Actinobacteria bacterium]|nr:replication-associated recombination protein A [Actinomycetota bacterium]
MAPKNLNIFDDSGNILLKTPLADRVRPIEIDELVGQDHILAPNSMLRRAIEEDKVSSMIFWGPPGSGKTTIARIIAAKTMAVFVSFSAVTSGIKEIKEVMAEAKYQRSVFGKKTILFIDEIHRFNKAQQDAFLPYVEDGTIVLIGATTENPSFEINSALLSRLRVYVLNALDKEDLLKILDRALTDEERGLGKENIELPQEAKEFLIEVSDGDARVMLNVLEVATLLAERTDGKKVLTARLIEEASQHKWLNYDRAGEEHYNIISAFHKSLRGSDPDAALYWLSRMLLAGEDPLYIARRMVRFASEDIGNADPMALGIAVDAMQAFNFVGMPEGNLALAQAAVYLATAPKSNSLYRAYGLVEEEIKKTGSLPVPLHIRNAPTRLMADLGYGAGYKYAHNYKDAHVKQEYLPDKVVKRKFYFPSNRGFESEIRRRIKVWAAANVEEGKEEEHD